MIRSRNLVASLLAVVFVATSGTDAAEYTVGNSAGWAVPHSHGDHYKQWAAEHKFHVGDTLVFNFDKGMHDVAMVTKAEYEACDGKKASETITDGPAKVKLHSPGEHYFICTFPHHCKHGQHLTVNVHGSSSPAHPPKTSSRKVAHTPSSAPAPGSEGSPSPTSKKPHSDAHSHKHKKSHSEAPAPGSEGSPTSKKHHSEAHSHKHKKSHSEAPSPGSEAPSPKSKRSMGEKSPSEAPAPAPAPGSGESPNEQPTQGTADYRK